MAAHNPPAGFGFRSRLPPSETNAELLLGSPFKLDESRTPATWRAALGGCIAEHLLGMATT